MAGARLAGLLAVAMLATAGPAVADAVTYRGTLGHAPIVVELSGKPTAAHLVGRYFYVSKGIDIPLDAAASTGAGAIVLAEEAPCTAATCPLDSDDNPTKPAPIGAHWRLAAKDGDRLDGTWMADGKSLPISLTRIGSRPLPADFDGTPQGLESIVSDLTINEQPITAEISPYDFAKVGDAPAEHARTLHFGSARYRYAVDPRTKFRFPTIVDLGGASPAAANAYLFERHARMSLDALSCEAQAYLGFGWNDVVSDAVGSLGGYPDETVTLNYLSPTVMSWNESGSLFCGGAHPDNHDENYSLDVRTGRKLDLSLIFKDWVPTPLDNGAPKDLATARARPDDYRWGPDDKLGAYVRSKIPASLTSGDAAQCGVDDLVSTNLAISFVAGDKARFSLDGLPYVIEACGGTLFDMPLDQLRHFLTRDADRYFPSLATK